MADEFDHETAIQKNMVSLVEQIQFKNTLLWDSLVSKELFTGSDMNFIKENNPAERNQIRELLSILMKRPLSHFVKFEEALKETGQANLVELIRSTKT